MDLERVSSVNGSVGNNNDGLRNDRGLNGEADNGSQSHSVQNNNHGDGYGKGKGESSPAVSNSEASPSSSATRKGFGLRKWKRIDRNSAKSSGGSGGFDASQFLKDERSNSEVNPSKRAQVYVEKEGSDNSVASTNAMVKSLEGFALSGEPILGTEALFGAGTDSDNSEDRSSKSSTAASGQAIRYDKPIVSGFPHDKSKLTTLSGKNSTNSVQRGSHHGKVQAEKIKKPRDASVKSLKETSVLSLESDSCTSNFVVMPETISMNNGREGEKQVDCDGETVTEVEKNYGDQGDKEGSSREEGYEDISHENGVADSSTEAKVDGKEVNGFSTDKDPLVEAVDSLQYAQEAIEKEMLKFREISKHVEDFMSDIHREAEADEQNPQETISENQEVEKEIELLLKNRIEAEVEYLTISSMLRNLRAEADALASAETQITEKLTDTRNKAVMLKYKAEEFEKVCEELASVEEESSKLLQTKICKYTSFFSLQMVLLVLLLGFFILKFQSYEDVVPT